MKPHLIAAHAAWKILLHAHDTVIDATAGNGYDTLLLFNLLQEGKLFVFDIQEKAIHSTKKKLSQEKSNCEVEFICGSHAFFPSQIKAESVKLIVYNLGYLPGGNKAITTRASSTLQSIKNALSLISRKGMISITLYPGHDEGRKETDAILAFTKNLQNWSVDHKRWQESSVSPSLLLLTKFSS